MGVSFRENPWNLFEGPAPVDEIKSAGGGYSNEFQRPGGRLNKKDGLTRYGDPMLKIRRPNGRLIFNMEIAIRR